MFWIFITSTAALIWLSILLAPWRPWSTRESLEGISSEEEDLSDITVMIPARNEADTIAAVLEGLGNQGRGHRIVLIDDQSSDRTTELALKAGLPNMTIVDGKDPPHGWSGKLWALQQGIRHVNTPLILLLDADIYLHPGTLSSLHSRLEKNGLDLVSLMAFLNMKSFWERMLMPAFIYFFKLLYPFRLSNSPNRHTAAAAGGCMLLKTETLCRIGWFENLRAELIDDCALAKRFKAAGGRTWIGMTRSAVSLRSYAKLKEIADMVSRSAFHQLRFSILLLLLCTSAMITLFWLPCLGLCFSSREVKGISVFALAVMCATYMPVLRFYGLSAVRAVFLPLIGTLYLYMTWLSAFRHWFGKGARWKGRSYMEQP